MPTIQVRDIDLYIDRFGTGDPVILSGGLSSDHRVWGYFFRALGKRYEVIRYDYRGIGKSERGTRPYTSQTLAEDLLGLIDALGLDRVHLVGASMGGPVCILAATQRPAVVRSLVLAVTSPHLAPDRVARFAQFRKILAEEGIEAYARKTIPLCLSEAYRTRYPENVERIIQTVASRESAASTILEQIDGCVGTNVRHLLPQISCPTLVLEAEQDELIEPVADRYRAGVANLRSETLLGSGHDIFVEQPDRTTRLVLDFLAETEE